MYLTRGSRLTCACCAVSPALYPKFLPRLLVVAAGVATIAPILEATVEDWDWTMNVSPRKSSRKKFRHLFFLHDIGYHLRSETWHHIFLHRRLGARDLPHRVKVKVRHDSVNHPESRRSILHTLEPLCRNRTTAAECTP